MIKTRKDSVIAIAISKYINKTYPFEEDEGYEIIQCERGANQDEYIVEVIKNNEIFQLGPEGTD